MSDTDTRSCHGIHHLAKTDATNQQPAAVWQDILGKTVRMHAFEHVANGQTYNVFGLTSSICIYVAQLALAAKPAYAMFAGTATAGALHRSRAGATPQGNKLDGARKGGDRPDVASKL
jgi:hypothetical protein